VEAVKSAILSNNEMQFQSLLWKGTMHKHDVKFDIPPLDTRKAIQVKVA
jgi:hypothetical protein